MDIGKYISSGILEQYVLGDLSEKERREVENHAAQYPEIRRELDAIEAALEEYAVAHAVTPSPGALKNILNRIQQQPAPGTPARKITQRGKVSSIAWWGLLLLLTLALGLGVLFLLEKRKSADGRTRVQALLAEQQQTRDSLAFIQRQLDIINDPKNIPVYIVKETPEGGCIVVAAVYWNQIEDANFLNVINLPALPSGKQYQLWAIVKNQALPNSMEPFDLPSGRGTLIERPYISDDVVAFAISIEPLGGSPQPTDVYAVGPAS